ncbi:MAG: hypothetical protein AB2536_10880 [Candidatus Thiodiazotropha endolucinida]
MESVPAYGQEKEHASFYGKSTSRRVLYSCGATAVYFSIVVKSVLCLTGTIPFPGEFIQ